MKQLDRVFNIAVLVLLPIVSGILFEHWRKYQRYFSYACSINMGVSDTF